MFPLTYRVVEQPQRQTNLLKTLLSLRLSQRTLHRVPEGFVLVNMAMAPFNPSDIAFLQGSYNVSKPLPAVPGFEGSGRVVAVAGDVDQSWLGQRVACFAGNETDGTWAAYVLARPEQLLVVDEQLSDAQAAIFLVNPFTARAMFDMALEQKCGAIALNAAGSSVAAWMRIFASRQGIETINIVRKAETRAQLQAQGVAHVLLSNEEDFDRQFGELAHRLDCRMAFDAVAGPLGGHMLNCMPDGSRLVVYGGLSNQPLADIDVLGLIFKKKHVRGFDLNHWWAITPSVEKQKLASEIAQLMLQQAPVPISATFGLDDVVQGIRYYLSHMSDGKVLLRMQ